MRTDPCAYKMMDTLPCGVHLGLGLCLQVIWFLSRENVKVDYGVLEDLHLIYCLEEAMTIEIYVAKIDKINLRCVW